MKRLVCGIILALAIAVHIPAMAQVSVNIGIPLPPPIPLPAPPDVVVLPDSDDVYVDPYIDADLFFWNGWWWRQWNGRWYRSRYYDRGWGYFDHVPRFYSGINPGWRGYFRGHRWNGHPWNYERVPYQRLQGNWRTWHNNGTWRRGTWGVRGYQPRPQGQFRQQRTQPRGQGRGGAAPRQRSGGRPEGGGGGRGGERR